MVSIMVDHTLEVPLVPSPQDHKKIGVNQLLAPFSVRTTVQFSKKITPSKFYSTKVNALMNNYQL